MSRAVRQSLWLALGVLALASVLVAALRVAERGRFSSPYSSYGAGPEGTLALFSLTRELGFDGRRLKREISHLERGTLIAVAGCRGGLVRPLVRPEREAIAAWVEAGGLLIVAGLDDYLPEASGLTLGSPPSCEEKLGLFARTFGPRGETAAPMLPARLEALPSGPPLATMLPFLAEHPHGVRVVPGNEATTLLDSEAGPLGLTLPLGRGRVVLLGVPEALTNRGLAHGGGVLMARLLEAFAPEGPVYFDEYHLGMGERRSVVRYLRDRGYGLALVQGLFVVLVALLARAVRLGPIESGAPELPLVARDYAAALGALYARSRDRQGALDVLARDALRRIARHHRAHKVPLEQLPAWLEERHLHTAAEAARQLESQRTQPLARGDSLLARAREIERDCARGVASDASVPNFVQR